MLCLKDYLYIGKSLQNHRENPRHITVLLGALILGVAFADRNEELNEALAAVSFFFDLAMGVQFR